MKIFVLGWAILLAAIVVNFFAVKLGLSTWYFFVDSISRDGLSRALKDTSIASIIFLFVVYPFILGLTGFLVSRFIK